MKQFEKRAIRNFKRVLAAALLCGAQVAFAQPGVQGHVLDSVGSRVAGASVIYRRVVRFQPPQRPGASPTQLAVGEQYVSGSAVTDTGGHFSAPALMPGAYSLCVSVDNPQHLDPCEWSPVQMVTVPAGALGDIEFKLIRGRRLRFSISDPLDLLTSTTSQYPLGNVTPGVQTQTGAIHVARTVTDTPGGRIYEITIPNDQLLRVWLWASELQIADQAGKTLDTSGPGSGIQISPGVANENIKLTVMGKKVR